MQNWLLIFVSVCAGVAGQVTIKLGVNQPGWALLDWAPAMFRSPLTLLGLGLYGIGAVAWIAVLKRLDLSYAYPFFALNFVLIVVASRLFLGEIVPPIRWLGLAFICLGVVLVSQGTPR